MYTAIYTQKLLTNVNMTEKSGGITLQNVRPSEGEIIQYYDKHKSTVSVLKLSEDETRALSGSWDKAIYEWDLQTGQIVREFSGSSGQISSIEWQPVGGTVISRSNEGEPPEEDDDDDEKSLGSLFGDDDNDDNDDDGLFGDRDGDDEKPTVKEDNKKNTSSHSVFMSSCIDGTIDIWDKRQQSKICNLKVPAGTPPWAMSVSI